MASKLSICNQALYKIGQKGIISLDEGSEASRLCEINFDQALKVLLRTYNWGCATKRIALTKNINPPLFGFPNSFALPPDFIRLIQAYDSGGRYNQKYRWAIEGKDLLTDIDEVYLKYTRLVDDVQDLDPLATDGLICQLAIRIAMARTESKTLVEALIMEYEDVILPRARSIDTIEDRDLNETDLGNWITSRNGSVRS